MTSSADPGRGPLVSVVMSLRDGGAPFVAYLERLGEALRSSFPTHEIVVVDNASPAGSMDGVRSALGSIPNVHLLRLTREMDVDIAMTAGLDHCIGDVVVTLHPLQDPPSAVVAAAELVARGNDVVYGVDRTLTEDRTLTYRLLARGWHWFFGRTSAADMPVVDFSLRAVSRRVLTTWLANTDRDRLLRVMPALSGFSYTIMPYEGDTAGRHRRSVPQAIRAGSRTLLTVSPAPLRIAYILALGAAILNLLYALYVVVIAAVRGDVVEGWVSLSLQSAGMFFLLSVILAILAEYVFQIVQRTAERPLYRIADEASSPALSIKEHLNVESPTEREP